MRIYLDDNRPTPAGWDRATTAEEVKHHLLLGEVDDLSLDFDLDMPHCDVCQFQCGHRDGKCHHGCSCHADGDETGGHLVRWMVATGRWPKNKPTIHSHNLDGALKMNHLVETHFPQK